MSEFYYKKCSCPDEARCPIRSVMQEVRYAIVGVVDRTTVADLCERWSTLEPEPGRMLDFMI